MPNSITNEITNIRLGMLEELATRLELTLVPTDELDSEWINEQQDARSPAPVKAMIRTMIKDIYSVVNSKRSRPDFTAEVMTQIDVAIVFIETLEAFGLPVAR